MALETDPHRLEQRQKQIDFGLATTGYANYVSWLKSNKGRVKPIPIPNIYLRCSKRCWDGQIRHWRRLLHLWDAAEQPTGTAEDTKFQDPCANEEVEYRDPEWPDAVNPSFKHTFRPQRMESPTPLSSASRDYGYLESAQHIKRSSSEDFTSVYGAHHPTSHAPYMPQHMPQGHSLPTAIPHHSVHLQPQFQLPQLIPTMPHSPALGYMYPAMPQPSWQFSFVPATYSGMSPMSPMYAPAGDDSLAARVLQLAGHESTFRHRLHDAEAAAMKALLYDHMCGALVAAAAAQKELAQRQSVPDPPGAWPENSLGMLLSDEFGNPHHHGSNADPLLPPSLSEPVPRRTSMAGCSDSVHSLTSMGDLRLDVERYQSFRRHFGESSQGGGSLESPPPCWSPAHLTPSFPGPNGVLSASPGLTPSPNDWLMTQRSPMQVSPRIPLAFSEWASPHPAQQRKDPSLIPSTSDNVLQMWSSTPPPPSSF